MNKFIIGALAAFSAAFSMEMPFQKMSAGYGVSSNAPVIVVESTMNTVSGLYEISDILFDALSRSNGLLGFGAILGENRSSIKTVWYDQTYVDAFNRSSAHQAVKNAFLEKKSELNLTVQISTATWNQFQ
ncbi:MAG: hypothetical protein CNLJKLNK_00698 [Holosporales bacterium]